MYQVDVLPSCSGVWEPYMGVLEPVPYMGVWDPYIGVRPWVDVCPLLLLAPLVERMNTAGEQDVRKKNKQ